MDLCVTLNLVLRVSVNITILPIHICEHEKDTHNLRFRLLLVWNISSGFPIAAHARQILCLIAAVWLSRTKFSL